MMRTRHACAALVLGALLVALPALAQADDVPTGGCLVVAESGADVPDVTYQGDAEPFKVAIAVSCHPLEGDTGHAMRLDEVEISYRMVDGGGSTPPRTRRQALRDDCTDSEQEHVVTLLTASQKKRDPFRSMTSPARVEATLTVHAHQIGAGGRSCTGTLRWYFDVRPGSAPRTETARPRRALRR